MEKPCYLKAKDRIRIVSPAGKIQPEKVNAGLQELQKEGFRLVTGPYAFAEHFRFAGSDRQRLSDLQEALDDPDCAAVFCSRGGYGAIRIAPMLDFTQFRKHPKWLVGFSDITVLHAWIRHTGFCSIHGAMPAFYLKDDQPTPGLKELIRMLKGEPIQTEFPSSPFNRTGTASGELTGGNLAILYSLLGTPFMPGTDQKILFIEDVSEHYYSIDRMMHSMKLSGMLENLKALIVGGFTELKDDDETPFGESVEEIILNVTRDYRYPVCFGFPAGHTDLNLPLMLGANYELNVTPDKVSLHLITT